MGTSNLEQQEAPGAQVKDTAKKCTMKALEIILLLEPQPVQVGHELCTEHKQGDCLLIEDVQVESKVC